MNNVRHTPGPWERDHNVIRTTRGTIALCPTPQAGGVFDCADNARLIAAAPDLLAALKAMSSFWAYGLAKPKGAKPNRADLKEVERLATMAADAVAKAEGVTE